VTARTAGFAAIALLAVSYAIPAQGGAANQDAQYALVRALAQGTPRIDRTRLQVGTAGTGDISYIHGHYFAAKAPGLAFAALAPYLLLKAAGYARPVGDPTGQLWYLTLWGALLPAVTLLLLVRAVANRLEPGFGTAAAVTLGVATMLLPFATLFFAHALSATLGFAVFAVLWHERQGPARPALVAAAGVLAGLAATVEFPVAVIGAILGLYAIARPGPLRRAGVYAAGVVIGSLPTLLFNEWAFGRVFEFSYADVVATPGAAENKVGLYGVTAPRLHTLLQLLFSRTGLLTMTPVLALGALGLVLLYRAGHRAEALVASGISLAYLLLIAGYQTPFGGYSPGPRFLVAIMPFLALGWAPAYRRFPATTAVLALCSAVKMAVVTATQPLLATFGGWFHRFASGQFEQTSLGLAGIGHVGIPLFLVGVCAAVALAAVASPRPDPSRPDTVVAALVVTGFILAASIDSDHAWDGLALATTCAVIAVLLPRGLRVRSP